jgi:hypothetical protein
MFFYNRWLQCHRSGFRLTPRALFKRGNKMISGKWKLISAAVGTTVVMASLALNWTVHYGAATATQVYGANAIVRSDGTLIGTAANPSIRSQLQQIGLPE